MSKYSVQFKKRVAVLYLSGRLSADQVAEQMCVLDSDVRQWAARYQAHGMAGLEKKYTTYSVAFKVKVLAQMDAEGLSGRAAAALFNIRADGMITRWRRAYDSGGIEALKPRPKGRPPAMKLKPPVKPESTEETPTVKQLLKENEYLRAEVAYLKKLDALIQAKKLAAPKKRK